MNDRICKWCATGSGPLVQLRVNGIFHRWSYSYKGTARKVPWTICGYAVVEVAGND